MWKEGRGKRGKRNTEVCPIKMEEEPETENCGHYKRKNRKQGSVASKGGGHFCGQWEEKEESEEGREGREEREGIERREGREKRKGREEREGRGIQKCDVENEVSVLRQRDTT